SSIPERRRRRTSCGGVLEQLDAVLLDHRVGEQLLAHLGQALAGALGVALAEVDLERLAGAYFAHFREADPLEGTADGLALGIENLAAGIDGDACLHGYTSGGSPPGAVSADESGK